MCQLGKLHISQKQTGFTWPDAATGLANLSLFGPQLALILLSSLKVEQQCITLTLHVGLLMFPLVKSAVRQSGDSDFYTLLFIITWPNSELLLTLLTKSCVYIVYVYVCCVLSVVISLRIDPENQDIIR